MYIFELASYLVVAILFGIGAGWLIWGDEPFDATPAADASGTEQAVADLSSQVETRDQEIVRLRKRLKRMHADMDARDLSLAEVKGRSEELEGILTQREAELQAAMNGEALPVVDNEVHVRRISELEELLAASRSEADGLARKLQETIATDAGGPDPELQQRLVDSEGRLAEINDSRAQLAAAHEELQRSHATISNDLAEAQARLDEMASGVDLAQHDRIRVLEAEISRLKAAEVSAQERAADLELQRQSASEALQASEQRAAELHEQLSAQPVVAQGVNEDVELELAKVHAELARSRQNVNSLRQRLQSVEDENESMAGDLARATTELQGRSAKSSEAVAQRDQLVSERDQLVLERDQLVSARQGLVTERDHLAAERDQLVSVRQELVAERDQLVSAREELAAERLHVSQERDRLSEQLNQLRDELTQVRHESTQERASVEGRLAETAAAAQAAQQRVDQLESQLAQAASSAEETQRLERSLSEMQAAHDSTVAQLHVELSEARLRADSAYEALHELNDEFINFRDVTMRQQNSMNSLADRLARANSSIGSRSATPEDSSGQ